MVHVLDHRDMSPTGKNNGNDEMDNSHSRLALTMFHYWRIRHQPFNWYAEPSRGFLALLEYADFDRRTLSQ